MEVLILLALVVQCLASRTFYVLSDIHYDIAYRQSANESSWCHSPVTAGLAEPGSLKPLGRYKCDSPISLLEAALSKMQAIDPSPEFIIVTGDSVAHFTSQLLTPKGTYSYEHSKGLVLGSFKEIVAQFREYFPETPLVPVIGNNDGFLDDTELRGEEAKNYYLSLFDIFDEVSELPFEFLHGGYYSLNLGYHLIVLNTNLFNAHAELDQKRGMAQLDWLQTQLRTSPGQAIIAMHIPPGVCMFTYGSVQWHAEFVPVFLEIVQKFADKIDFILTGHLHSGIFELIPNTPFHILGHPALSPIFGNNPGLRHYTITDNNRDYSDYFFDLNTTTWKKSFTYSTFFQQETLNMDAVYLSLVNNRTKLDEFLLHTYGFETDISHFWKLLFHSDYESSRDKGQRAALCSFRYIHAEDFFRCLNSEISLV